MSILKTIRSYTSIWNVEKIIYAINDLKLPFPVTFNQMTWFVLTLLSVMLLSNVPPFSWIEGAFLKYLAIPIFTAWFMSQKTFDGKKPIGFLSSIGRYYMTSRKTFAGKAVAFRTVSLDEEVTIVRSEVIEISN